MITENYTKQGEFLIKFDNFNGSSWVNNVFSIIEEYIKPTSIEKRVIEETWDYTEIELDIEKDNVKFTIHIDDEGSRYAILVDEVNENSKQKLRDWALIVAKEIEKIK